MSGVNRLIAAENQIEGGSQDDLARKLTDGATKEGDLLEEHPIVNVEVEEREKGN